MISRRDAERRNLDARIRDVVDHARVFQGGGYEVDEGSLQASVKVALDAAVQRLFPNFGVADHPRWSTVFERAKQGAPDALSAVDYVGDPDKHPATQLIATFVGAGKKGSEVRARFTGAGYGWPQDAVDASLLVLVASDVLEAKVGSEAIKPSQITRQTLGATEFRRVDIIVTAIQRLAVRRLLSDLTFPAKSGEEAAALPLMLQRLAELARAAGGEAPLPERPSTATIAHLQSLSGNEQFVAVYDRREDLLRDYRNWTSQGELVRQRLPRWEQLLRLRRHAEGLPSLAAELDEQIEGIRQGRSLLTNPDPVVPLVDQLVDVLRCSLQEARTSLASLRERELRSLEGSEAWAKLPESDRASLLSQHGIMPVPEIQIGTDDALLRTLDKTPLGWWRSEVQALPGRVAGARREAARMIEPKIVTIRPPHRTLREESEVDAYLKEFRSEIMEHIRNGNPVML